MPGTWRGRWVYKRNIKTHFRLNIKTNKVKADVKMKVKQVTTHLGESGAAPFFSSDTGTAPFLMGVSGGRSLSNSSGEMN